MNGPLGKQVQGVVKTFLGLGLLGVLTASALAGAWFLFQSQPLTVEPEELVDEHPVFLYDGKPPWERHLKLVR